MDLTNLANYEAKSAAVANGQGDAGDDFTVGDYTVIRELGKGAFGRVVLAKKQGTGELAAIKLLPRGAYMGRYNTYVGREILHQASLRHPFVVGLKQVILTPQKLAIVMEYASGGTLAQHLRECGKLSEAQARWIFQQLIIGLAYIHRMGVANRDLKLDNLLLNRRAEGAGGGDWPLLKICDFGYSKHELNSTAKTSVGTPMYMAPEVIGGSGRYSAKRADIWSCGVILYTLLFNVYPFNPETKDYAMAIIQGQWSIPTDAGVSEEATHLLKQMMAFDPLLRIDIPGIMAHPWFKRALPEGAAAMNDIYLAHAPRLDSVVPVIEGMVRAAETEGPAGAPLQVVAFELLSGGSSSGGAMTGGMPSGSGPPPG